MTIDQEIGRSSRDKVNGQTPEELAVESAVHHHVSSYQRVVNERDALQKLVDKQEQMLTVAKIEIEGLRAERAAAVTRTENYQYERDKAVADRAKLAALLQVMHTAMHEAAITDFISEAKQ